MKLEYMNPFDSFDQIYYINLDKRPDRKEQILSELRRMDVNMNKVTRIAGVISKFGAHGCSLAHLNCLNDCIKRKYKNCLILEDDFIFTHDRQKTHNLLNQFFDTGELWDVILFGGGVMKHENTEYDFFVKILDAQTTSGYAVNTHYIQTLQKNFDESSKLLGKHPRPIPRYCIDMYWKRLQPRDNWFIITPKLGYQREGYSDIEKKNVNYKKVKEEIQNVPIRKKPEPVISQPKPVKSLEIPKNCDDPQWTFFLAVKSCRSRLGMALSQREKYLQKLDTYKIVSYIFVGDPTIQEKWNIDEERKIVTLKCKDDYLNVAHKTRLIIEFVNTKYPNITGMFQTDDDTEINLKLLSNMLTRYKDRDYFGHCANMEDDEFSYHIMERRKLLTDYPMLKHYPIFLKKCNYCAGGGFYLNKKVFHILLTNRQELFQELPKDLKRYFTKIQDKECFIDIPIIDDYLIGYVLQLHGIKALNIDIKKAVNWTN